MATCEGYALHLPVTAYSFENNQLIHNELWSEWWLPPMRHFPYHGNTLIWGTLYYQKAVGFFGDNVKIHQISSWFFNISSEECFEHVTPQGTVPDPANLEFLTWKDKRRRLHICIWNWVWNPIALMCMCKRNHFGECPWSSIASGTSVWSHVLSLLVIFCVLRSYDDMTSIHRIFLRQGYDIFWSSCFELLEPCRP